MVTAKQSVSNSCYTFFIYFNLFKIKRRLWLPKTNCDSCIYSYYNSSDIYEGKSIESLCRWWYAIRYHTM